MASLPVIVDLMLYHKLDVYWDLFSAFLQYRNIQKRSNVSQKYSYQRVYVTNASPMRATGAVVFC